MRYFLMLAVTSASLSTALAPAGAETTISNTKSAVKGQCPTCYAKKNANRHDGDGDKVYILSCTALMMAGVKACDELPGNNAYNNGRASNWPTRTTPTPAPNIEMDPESEDTTMEISPR